MQVVHGFPGGRCRAPGRRVLRRCSAQSDGRMLIVTSANMSASAAEHNVELGPRLEDPVLTCAVEERMRALEPLPL